MYRLKQRWESFFLPKAILDIYNIIHGRYKIVDLIISLLYFGQAIVCPQSVNAFAGCTLLP